MTPTTQPAEHRFSTKAILARHGLVGMWICRCDSCGRQIARQCGSTQCCGSTAEIIAIDPDWTPDQAPESAIEQAREALELALTTIDDANGSSYHIDGDACLTPGAQRDRQSTMEVIRNALSNLTPATDKQG